MQRITYPFAFSEIIKQSIAYPLSFIMQCITYPFAFSEILPQYQICSFVWDHHMTVSTENATHPKSTESTNSDSLVSRGSNYVSNFGPIWVCTGEYQFYDLVDFGGVKFSVESVLLYSVLRIHAFSFKLKIWTNLNLYRGISGFRFGGSRGCSIFCGIYYLVYYVSMHLYSNTVIYELDVLSWFTQYMVHLSFSNIYIYAQRISSNTLTYVFC